MIKPLLAIACLLSSISVSAYDFKVDGIYYDVVSLSACRVVKGDVMYSGDVVIPARVNYANKTLTVIEIGASAFYKSEITGITIPNTIIKIYNNAFKDCYNLEHVNIEDGESVLKLGHNYSDYGLFHECPITSLYLGRNLSYEEEPFQNIEELKDVTIGNSVTEIGDGVFDGCSGLTSITIPNSVTEIGYCAFLSLYLEA